uniref:BZIP domain-containing protein n=1 Tax=Oryzias sinensis TaxID=183150 RepID=A0A8C8DXK0_9TELE
MLTCSILIFPAVSCTLDEGRRLKRREKNRVAAQRSRKRQMQRADLLHEACELLEQRNKSLKREVTDTTPTDLISNHPSLSGFNHAVGSHCKAL